MIRPLFKTDVPEVLVIEQAVHVVPWTEETFKACFQAGYLGWVMEVDKKIIGFIMVSLYLEECHILNIVIARDFQRKGHGHALLSFVLEYAKQHGIGIVYLEVRRSNSRAIHLYKKMHFQLVGERKNYYPTVSGEEDALIFAKNLHLNVNHLSNP